MTHRSWSQLTSYTNCSEAYRLQRIEHAPEAPAWWFIAGKAFHSGIEYINYGGEATPEEIWEHFFGEEYDAAWSEEGPPPSQWRTGGRKSKQWPDGETPEFYAYAGPGWLLAYKTWLALRITEGWNLAVLPDGRMGIEVEYAPLLGDVSVKMVLDFILEKDDDWLVVDAKTGSRVPGPGQLGLYACGLELAYGKRPSHGAYYMARQGDLSPVADLSRYTPQMLGAQFRVLDKGIRNEIFLPNPSPLCGSCGVNRYCESYGGDQAHLYSIATSNPREAVA